jgi:ABC-type lipoprotein export system ATPase subunit
MSLLSLRGIGKIYVSEGSVAVGLRGVDLDLDIGEFVAVTGKSGSGKTTLLNMLSGMDTYEEGELYIEGEPTSHYEQSDWENYRKKYISFIFQDYNIIDSFTVLQNVELALSYIDSPRERRERALELIERVGLTRFKNHKGSKLSGGQKQRTVIARALAKDSPIILADEPTGNLDAKSSEEIIALLAEISKDKLVVVVTHSAQELEAYATREIRIFDGEIERDTELRPAEKRESIDINEGTKKAHILRRGVELGVHRFRAMPKLSIFMCMLMVLAIMGTFFATITMTYDMNVDYDVFFPRDGRVIITRHDGGVPTEDEISSLASRMGAEDYARYDYLYDTQISINGLYEKNGRSYRVWSQIFAYIDDGKYSADVGSEPASADEVMLVLPIEWKQIYGDYESRSSTPTVKLCGKDYTICGIDYFYDNTKTAYAVFSEEGFEDCTKNCFISAYNFGSVKAACDAKLLDLPSGFDGIYIDDTLTGDEFYISCTNYKIVDQIKQYKGDVDIEFRWEKFSHDMIGATYSFVPDSTTFVAEKCKVSSASEYVDEGYYYEDMFGDVYMEDVEVKPMGNSASIYISRELADEVLKGLRDPNYRQSSLFFKNDSEAEKKLDALRDEGYYAVLSDNTFTTEGDKIIAVFTNIFTVFGWVITLIFLSLFLYICSARAIVAKRGDIAILRSMGIENRIIKISMYAQTALAMIPSFVILAIVAAFIYTSPSLNPLFPFMHAWQYAMIVLGMMIINLYISRKYNKKMFKESVRKTLRGGAKE